MLFEGRTHGVQIVVGQHDGVRGLGAGDTGRRRQPERRDPGSRIRQQRVDMAVIAPGELDDLGPAGIAASQAHRTHGRLGTGVHQAHLLHRSDPLHDEFGEFHLPGRGRTERQPVARDRAHRLDHRGMRMPEDHRPPGTHQVDILVTVRVDQMATAGGRDEPRRAAHRTEGPHRGIDTTGDNRFGSLEKLTGGRHRRTGHAQRTHGLQFGSPPPRRRRQGAP